jgi:biopolymer transport protein ExbD
MRIPSRAISGEVGFNMTPMIDVVFQLIIFFLLSSHLAKQESQLPLPLPTAASGQELDDGERPRITVNVLSDGTLVTANRPIAPPELAVLLVERRAAHGDALEVRIRSDRSVPYSRVEPVLLACARAGVWNVAYAVYRKGDIPSATDK